VIGGRTIRDNLGMRCQILRRLLRLTLKVSYFTVGRAVTTALSRAISVQGDGEHVDRTSVTIQRAQSGIRVVVPPRGVAN
jgi:hypothetical protein